MSGLLAITVIWQIGQVVNQACYTQFAPVLPITGALCCLLLSSFVFYFDLWPTCNMEDRPGSQSSLLYQLNLQLSSVHFITTLLLNA